MGRSSAFPRDDFRAVRLDGALEEDARMAVRTGMSLMVIDPGQTLLEAIRSWAPEPIAACSGARPLALPDPDWVGTLLICDVDRLDVSDQLALLDWHERSSRSTQIISTATASLLPRVRRGEFLEALYYRLNIVCIDVTACAAAGRAPVSAAELFADGASFEWPPRL